MTRRTLWPCPTCRRRFASKNQSHFCSAVPLSAHFKHKPPEIRRLYSAFLKALRKHGPLKVLPEKTRIAFQVRMSFAAVMTRRGYLRGHLVLAERHDSPCFTDIQTFSARNHLHAFILRSEADIAALRPFIALAYRVGRQEHLSNRL